MADGATLLESLFPRRVSRTREVAGQRRTQNLRQDIAELLKQGPISEVTGQETVPAIPSERVGTTFGGRDISFETAGIPEITQPKITETPARERPEFKNKLIDLASEIGGKTFMDVAKPDVTSLFGKIPVERTTAESRKAFTESVRAGQADPSLLEITAKTSTAKSFKKFKGPDGRIKFFDIAPEGAQEEIAKQGFVVAETEKGPKSKSRENSFLSSIAKRPDVSTVTVSGFPIPDPGGKKAQKAWSIYNKQRDKLEKQGQDIEYIETLMESTYGPQAGKAPKAETFTTADGQTVTGADLEFTAKEEGLTIEQVKAELGIK